MKNHIKIIRRFIFIAAIFIPISLFAQPGFDDNVEDVPIDGGVSILAAAAIAYGVKRIAQNKEKSDI